MRGVDICIIVMFQSIDSCVAHGLVACEGSTSVSLLCFSLSIVALPKALLRARGRHRRSFRSSVVMKGCAG